MSKARRLPDPAPLVARLRVGLAGSRLARLARLSAGLRIGLALVWVDFGRLLLGFWLASGVGLGWIWAGFGLAFG